MKREGPHVIGFLTYPAEWLTQVPSRGRLLLLLALGLVQAEARAGAMPLRFDFGSGAASPGWTRVDPASGYTNGAPYGLLAQVGVEAGRREGGVGRRSDYLAGSDPFFFAAEVPEGNYQVTVHAGDPRGPSVTTVKAESRRVMIKERRVEAGGVGPLTFCVNMRTPALAGGGEVRLNEREIGHPDWDHVLTLEFAGENLCVSAVEIEPAPEAVTLYLAGDSTVTDQRDEPWSAWGQMLPCFFGSSLAVANHAESGRTLDSFRDQKRLEKILDTLRAGDYLFMQFGHNDMKQKGEGKGPFLNFSDNLRTYVELVRARDAFPVIVTPMHRRWFDGEGRIQETFGEYPEAMRRVAEELDVPLIDLHKDSRILFEALGKDGSRNAFVHYPANSFPGQTEPLKDDSHFSPYGAYQLAQCMVMGIREHVPNLTPHLRDGIPEFDPANPDPFEAWRLPASPLFDLKAPEGD